MNFLGKVKVAGYYFKEAAKTLFGKSASAKVVTTEFVGYEGGQENTDPPPTNSLPGGGSNQGVPPNIDAEAANLLNMPHIRSTSGVRFEQIKEQGAVMGHDSMTIATPQGMHE